MISKELARTASPAAATMFGNDLRRACAVATDVEFLSAISETTSIASNASTGLTASAFLSDLATALQSVTIGANNRPYLILPPGAWKAVVLLRDTGGMLVTNNTIGPIRVIPSDSATDTGYLIDASQIAAESDAITLSVAEHAAVQMDDNPTSGEAGEMISLWQHDLRGLKAERAFGIEVLRSTAAALITGINVTA